VLPHTPIPPQLHKLVRARAPQASLHHAHAPPPRAQRAAPTHDSSAAATTVPRMLPTDVFAFHMPMMRPRFPLPDQLATMDTTLGQPVDWNSPASTDTIT
jgi:hypothetical protein